MVSNSTTVLYDSIGFTSLIKCCRVGIVLIQDMSRHNHALILMNKLSLTRGVYVVDSQMAFVSSLTTARGSTFKTSTSKRRLNHAETQVRLRMTLSTRQKTQNLRSLLAQDDIHLMPCCYDGLSAKLIQRSEFKLTFLSGFSTAAAHGLPDTGLLSFTEMERAIIAASSAVDIPLIADGDTGFGNAINVRRTIAAYARAGASGVLIEDQVNPKRCGHTRGKAVVDREEALTRVRAACDARDEISDSDGGSGGPIIIARTDAARFDFEEALTRAKLFHELGADVTFLEAPQSIQQMERYCSQVPGLKLANMLEMGDTPILPPNQLREIGYSLAAYPLTLISAAVKAQQVALLALKGGDPKHVQTLLTSFEDLRDVVGFPDYYALEDKYKSK